MMDQARGSIVPATAHQPLDYASLAEFLGALAYPVRLELLDILRFPHALREIKLAPRRSHRGERPTRTASQQAIHTHLGRLVDADLVRLLPLEEGGGRALQRYVVNPPKLYALTEELRRLSIMHAGRGAPGDATGTLVEPPHPSTARGPRLVLVHGVYEGKAFPLNGPTAQEGPWVIGRRAGIAVSLDYDPYVSLENALLSRRGGQYVLTDLPGSKNGTMVNWATLPKGGSQPLRSGDIIGVGRSRLCFVPE